MTQQQSKAKQANEQAKAQNLFAKWRKEETLYKEDEKNATKEEKSSIKSIAISNENIDRSAVGDLIISSFFIDTIHLKITFII